VVQFYWEISIGKFGLNKYYGIFWMQEEFGGVCRLGDLGIMATSSAALPTLPSSIFRQVSLDDFFLLDSINQDPT
jgi:hypothetical protein